MLNIEEEIRNIAERYARNLDERTLNRVNEMKSDDLSHYLIYQVLNVTLEEGELIDLYQNKGRFLYKYAGSFLEEVTILCFENKFGENAQKKIKVPNTEGTRPKNFEIDCLVNQNAYEIKWRDATTDGDHITKEHTRIKAIQNAGYIPCRIMFYYPNRTQAKRIQATLETLYKGINGEYHYGDDAWKFVYTQTGIDLKRILEKIALDNMEKAKYAKEQKIIEENLEEIIDDVR